MPESSAHDRRVIGSLVDAAVLNNALWCDAVCRALDRATVFDRGLWLNLDESPPLYPNAITLSRNVPAMMERLEALDAAGLPSGWALKDSFAGLDLAALGFDVLFEASWIALPARRPPMGDPRAQTILNALGVGGTYRRRGLRRYGAEQIWVARRPQ